MADLDSDPGDQEARRCADLRCFGAGKSDGAHAMYVYQATRTRSIASHGTNSPNISAAIWSGCIRLTNEDVIDLYTG